MRPLVLVGDGAFQMTGMELSTAVRLGLNPVVIVLNNGGYGTERFLLEGRFNDIHAWRYHKLPDLLGAGCGFEVRTEPELEDALTAALANRDSFSLLNVHLSVEDTSPALRRFADRLARRV
jgi:indolepyruvate decarboxylase